jgi:hypothetical protein
VEANLICWGLQRFYPGIRHIIPATSVTLQWGDERSASEAKTMASHNYEELLNFLLDKEDKWIILFIGRGQSQYSISGKNVRALLVRSLEDKLTIFEHPEFGEKQISY